LNPDAGFGIADLDLRNIAESLVDAKSVLKWQPA
jgi:hypothetical protein